MITNFQPAVTSRKRVREAGNEDEEGQGNPFGKLPDLRPTPASSPNVIRAKRRLFAHTLNATHETPKSLLWR